MSKTKAASENSFINDVAITALYGSIIELDNLGDGKIAKLSLLFLEYSSDSFFRRLVVNAEPVDPLIELNIRNPEKLEHEFTIFLILSRYYSENSLIYFLFQGKS